MADLRIVFHVNENNRWPFTIRSAHNLVHSKEQGCAVVVANGGAIRAFSQLDADPAQWKKIKALAEDGVRFVVCKIAMDERQINPDLLPSYVDIVPAGIVEIAKLQAQGYGYIKA